MAGMEKFSQMERGRSMSIQARREEEFEAVRAIYGEDVSIYDHEDQQLIKFRIELERLYVVVCIIICCSYPSVPPVSISIETWHDFLTESMIGELNRKLEETCKNDLKDQEVLYALFEITREFLEEQELRLNKSPSIEDLTSIIGSDSDVDQAPTIHEGQANECMDGFGGCISKTASEELCGEANESAKADVTDVAFRAVTLDFLIKFTCEHDLWHVPTYQVVKDIIIPTMSEHGGGPYTSILREDEVGQATIFISHAWSNSFGLAVAAARKYVGDNSSRNNHVHRKQYGRDASEDSQVFLWIDVFAITQQQGAAQMHDLSQLEPTIANEKCRTLVILDEEAGIPLKRCWCLFEIYATLQHCGLQYSGKLQVRAGKVVGRYGEFQPCSNRDKLVELAAEVDASSALCTVESDKQMILKQIEKLGGTDRNCRNGLHELNRILQRAVRHGWT